jgi:hypothetical protein
MRNDAGMTRRRIPAMLAGVGVAAIAAPGQIVAGPWWRTAWPQARHVLGAHWHWLALLLTAVGGTGLAAASLLRRRTTRPKQPAAAARIVPVLLTDRAIAAITIVVVLLGVATLVVLLAVASTGTPADRPRLRIDAIKSGLGVIAGAEALALLLAIRRQRLAERTQEHTEIDATEKRVTELYTKAIESSLARPRPLSAWVVSTPWNVWPRTPSSSGRPSSRCSAPTCACLIPRRFTILRSLIGVDD